MILTDRHTLLTYLWSGHEGRNQRHNRSPAQLAVHGGHMAKHVGHVWGPRHNPKARRGQHWLLPSHDFGPIIDYHLTTPIKRWSICNLLCCTLTNRIYD